MHATELSIFFAFYQDFIIMLLVAIKMYAWSIVWGFSSGHGDVSYNTLLYGLVNRSTSTNTETKNGNKTISYDFVNYFELYI